MKIVNNDAPIELVEKVQSLMIPRFILDVIKPLEKEYSNTDAFFQMEDTFIKDDNSTVSTLTPPLRMLWKHVIGYDNIVTLIHTIPIYLRDIAPVIKDETGVIDELGAYYPIVPNNTNIKRDSPYIELFLTPINKASKRNKTHFKWLFTKVLLHELAHAAMDIHNIKGYENATEQVSYSYPFGRWREESMANAVALRIIKDYENDVRYCCQKGFYDYARKFMEDQESEYALGVKLEQLDCGDFHRYFHDNLISKINGVDDNLYEKWIDYVNNGNPDEDGLKEWNDALSSKFAYIFNNKIYTRSNVDELITDIVTPVLDNYKNANNSEMNEAIFISKFKYLNVIKYSESTDDIEEKYRYSRIPLKEGDFLLHQNHSDILSTLFNDAGVKDKYLEYNNYKELKV